MSITLATAGLIGAGVGAGVNALGNIATNATNAWQAEKTRQFNREEAQKNREFQKEMAQNNIKYAVQQANDLGISPSLILGDQTNSLGGSQASVSGGQAHFDMNGISSATNSLINALNENNKIRAMEEMNEDKLQTLKDIERMRMANSTQNFERNGKEYYDSKSFLTDLKNVKL